MSKTPRLQEGWNHRACGTASGESHMNVHISNFVFSLCSCHSKTMFSKSLDICEANPKFNKEERYRTPTICSSPLPHCYSLKMQYLPFPLGTNLLALCLTQLREENDDGSCLSQRYTMLAVLKLSGSSGTTVRTCGGGGMAATQSL